MIFFKENTSKEVLQRWVTALRSGEYEQGQSYLRTSTGYCCLGVLQDLSIQDGLSPAWTNRDSCGLGKTIYVSGVADTCNSKSVILDAGMRKGVDQSWENPVDLSALDSLILMNLNDTGSNFEQIADVIQAHIDGL